MKWHRTKHTQAIYWLFFTFPSFFVIWTSAGHFEDIGFELKTFFDVGRDQLSDEYGKNFERKNSIY